MDEIRFEFSSCNSAFNSIKNENVYGESSSLQGILPVACPTFLHKKKDDGLRIFENHIQWPVVPALLGQIF